MKSSAQTERDAAWQGFRWCRFTLRVSVYARDDWTCLACGHVGTWRRGRGTWADAGPRALSLDHVLPRSEGGPNTSENLITLCRGCNSHRQKAPILEWRPDIWDAVLDAVTTPVDRLLGVELARVLDPRWFAREGYVGLPQPRRPRNPALVAVRGRR